ncbi:monomethylamine:corrinoid methyltransferase [Chloroflexota bacterium]
MKNMGRLLDVIDRSTSGPVCDEKEFELKYVADGVARVVEKYGIQFDKSRIIQVDDDMNDRVWQAAIDFLEQCGVYNTDTGRRITFSRREIEEAIKWAPDRATIGTGADVREVVYREIGDPRPPIILSGPIGVPLREDLYVTITQSYMQEPVIDSMAPGCLETCLGREVRSKSPMEVIACWREIDLMFTALRQAGRPGMPVGVLVTSSGDAGYLSGIGRGGYRPTDRHTIALVGEMKTNNELLNKVVHSVRQDGFIHGFYNPILGGLGGGEEGLSVLITAGMIGVTLIYMAVTQATCPTHPFLFNDTAPQILRTVSVSTAAISRNSPLLSVVMTSPVGGPGTETLLYECVAMATTATVCGAANLLGVRSAVGVIPNHCSGLEGRFNGEIGHAAAGLTREEANGIVEKAVAQYEPVMDTKPVGKPFWEVYDPLTIQPTDEWLAIYDKVKAQSASWGLRYK